MNSTALPADRFAPPIVWHRGYAALGDHFAVPVAPSPVPAPYWISRNSELGQALALPAGWQDAPHWLQALSGNAVLSGSEPMASVYSGHQFGAWAGQLGDGRALLLGETAGMELQLKGAGLTPFSRMGDGRAVLRSSIREYLCSEAMHGLGIPTTRALALTGSPLPVRRETVETAAILTRVAPSFIRFGHFEHFCHHDQHPDLQVLADYVIDRYYPECRSQSEWPDAYVALLACVTERTAKLVAQWQSVGFCHGVLNTDNMSILGLTLDYGPFQFLDSYNPAHICNHSDTRGRYAYDKQPGIAYWNLFALGQALLPLIADQNAALAALETYKPLYASAYTQRMAAKLGFAQDPDPALRPEVASLLEDGLQLLAQDRVDYTIFWRRLSDWSRQADFADTRVCDLFLQPAAARTWLQRYAGLADRAGAAHSTQTMLAHNPHTVLRNHLCELTIRDAQQQDHTRLEELLQVLAAPFDETTRTDHLTDFAPDWAAGLEVSCSS